MTGDRLDDLIARARALSDRLELGEPVDEVRRRKRRRRTTRRAQAAVLIAIVLAGTVGGTFALVRTLGARHRPGPAGGAVSNGRIAYASKVSGDNEVWAVNADGTGRVDLTNDPAANDFSPAWSPNGRSITFSKWRGADRGIFVMTGTGSGVKRLSTGSDFGAAWSPDGMSIAFSRGHGIWIMNADGTDLREISHSEKGDRDPSWSPDGARLAFSRGMESIALVFVDGSGLVVISGGGEAQPAWSPDGTLIAFQRGDELFTMAIDGSGLRQLTSGNGVVLSRQPSWSPDGTAIVFERRDGPTLTLAVIDATGTNARALDAPGGTTFAMSPSWQAIP